VPYVPQIAVKASAPPNANISKHSSWEWITTLTNGDVDFANTFRDYYDSTGKFSSESMWLDGHAESYEKAVSLVFYYSICAELNVE
jgi:hypothetical protein